MDEIEKQQVANHEKYIADLTKKADAGDIGAQRALRAESMRDRLGQAMKVPYDQNGRPVAPANRA
jgi:hypothetical protein